MGQESYERLCSPQCVSFNKGGLGFDLANGKKG